MSIPVNSVRTLDQLAPELSGSIRVGQGGHDGHVVVVVVYVHHGYLSPQGYTTI